VKQLTLFLEFLWKNLNTAAGSLAQSALLLPAAGLKDAQIEHVIWAFYGDVDFP